MVNWLLVVGRLLIVEDQYSVYQSTGSSYTLDSWRPALGSTGAHIPRSIINHAAANAPKKLSLLDGAVTFVCNCVLARIWELLVLTSCICVYLMKLLGGQREPARWFELRYPTVCLKRPINTRLQSHSSYYSSVAQDVMIICRGGSLSSANPHLSNQVGKSILHAQQSSWVKQLLVWPG